MPIRGLLDVQEAAFDPEDITALIAAHEMALKRLGVTGPQVRYGLSRR